MKRPRLILCAALLVPLALSSCGLRGRLERPTPLWGNPPDEGAKDPRVLKAQRDQAAADKAKKKADQEAEAARRAAETIQQSQPTPMSQSASPAQP